jgi:hypothetical protein
VIANHLAAIEALNTRLEAEDEIDGGEPTATAVRAVRDAG